MRRIAFIGVCFMAITLGLISGNVHAQEAGSIQGLVLEKGTSTRVASVNVRNKATRTTVSTDLRGVFRIYAQVGDTLMFTKLGFETHLSVVHSLSDILIDLQASSYRIETVTVEQRNREEELREGMDSYRRQGVYQEGKPGVLSYVFSPITSLYERFSKQGRQARRFRNYMDREVEAIAVDRLFSAYKITSLTGLKDRDLENFMLIYRPSYEAIQAWNDYDLTKYVLDSFKKYEADGRPEALKLPQLKLPPVHGPEI